MHRTRSQVGSQGPIDPDIERTTSTLTTMESLLIEVQTNDILFPTDWVIFPANNRIRLHDELPDPFRAVYLEMFLHGFRFPVHP